MSTRKDYGKGINFDREKKIEFTLAIISLIFIVIGFLNLQTEQQIGFDPNIKAPKITGKVIDEFTINAFNDCAADTTNGIWNITSNEIINLNQTCDIIHVNNNAILTVNNSAYNNNTIKLEANSVTIDSGSSINASGKGFYGGTGSNGNGPGAGSVGIGSTKGGGGGGHGSIGGAGGTTGVLLGGNTYGSITTPINLGSGGGTSYDGAYGGAGGGAIILNVSGTLKNNGNIIADGVIGKTCTIDNGGGGGSGGSIWIFANAIQGNGNISAKGGDGKGCGSHNGASGGGGRISYSCNENTFTGLFNRSYGLSSAGRMGSIGTLNNGCNNATRINSNGT